MNPRFLQIHTLTGYAATLLNRDDIGRAKRLPFGGCERIRVSSQCLKRHWREATGEWSLSDLGTGKSKRSRRLFSRVIAGRLRDRGMPEDRIASVLAPIMKEVLGESAKAKETRMSKDKSREEPRNPLDALETQQVIVLGEPELQFLTDIASDLSAGDEQDTVQTVGAYFKDKGNRKNLGALRQGAGLDAALFGRMVTSDILARSDAAVHVSHSFTVHKEEAEPDYFSALDDLVTEEGELGSGHINTTELTSGLFYSYVVVDLGQLTSNLSNDSELAKNVLRRLPHLIATVSPGAKRGATAPYACAEVMLAEAGARQPRTLANAFMKPVSKRHEDMKSEASKVLGDYLRRYDAMYGVHEERRIASMVEPVPDHAGKRVTLDELADWAAAQIEA